MTACTLYSSKTHKLQKYTANLIQIVLHYCNLLQFWKIKKDDFAKFLAD